MHIPLQASMVQNKLESCPTWSCMRQPELRQQFDTTMAKLSTTVATGGDMIMNMMSSSCVKHFKANFLAGKSQQDIFSELQPVIALNPVSVELDTICSDMHRAQEHSSKLRRGGSTPILQLSTE